MDRIATTTGLYPLPDWAKVELRGLKGRQRDDLISGDEGGAIVETYDTAREEVIERQRAAGLDRIVEGQLRWDDMLCHPLAVHEAVETGGLRRYYDNNNFYRETIVTDALTQDGDLAEELSAAAELAGDRPLQAVLPGPYSLSRLATDDHYGDDEAFLAALAEFLAGEVELAPAVDTAFLLEPSLGSVQPDDAGVIGEALDVVAAGFDADTDVIVHPYWGTPSRTVYTTLLESTIDGIGFDLVEDADRAASLVDEHGAPAVVSLGVVDGQNTRVESVEELHARVEAFTTAGGDADRAYLTTNTETFYLPVAPFEEKLDVLGHATTHAEVAR